MGMGGDQLVGEVAGEDFDREHGEDARAAEKDEYGKLIDEVQVLPGARELIRELRERGHDVILASSAKEEEIEHYVEMLEADGVPYTTSADVETTKPAPDLIEAALEKLGGGPAVMIGDSTWDCKAAARAGVSTVAVLTGGFSDEELRGAGAVQVFESIDELRSKLDEVFSNP
jgi:HAD superfamily hydrolase (TIGR01549 family)